MYIYCCGLRSSKFKETRFKSRFGSQGKTLYAFINDLLTETVK